MDLKGRNLGGQEGFPGPLVSFLPYLGTSHSLAEQLPFHLGQQTVQKKCCTLLVISDYGHQVSDFVQKGRRPH